MAEGFPSASSRRALSRGERPRRQRMASLPGAGSLWLERIDCWYADAIFFSRTASPCGGERSLWAATKQPRQLRPSYFLNAKRLHTQSGTAHCSHAGVSESTKLGNRKATNCRLPLTSKGRLRHRTSRFGHFGSWKGRRASAASVLALPSLRRSADGNHFRRLTTRSQTFPSNRKLALRFFDAPHMPFHPSPTRFCLALLFTERRQGGPTLTEGSPKSSPCVNFPSLSVNWAAPRRARPASSAGFGRLCRLQYRIHYCPSQLRFSTPLSMLIRAFFGQTIQLLCVSVTFWVHRQGEEGSFPFLILACP